MEWAYLAGLLFAIAGMLVLDWRFKLAFWQDARRAALTLATGLLFFILWDFLGIFLGIFKRGESPYSLPVTLAPEFPFEEIAFLFLIVYCALVISNGVHKWRSHI